MVVSIDSIRVSFNLYPSEIKKKFTLFSHFFGKIVKIFD